MESKLGGAEAVKSRATGKMSYRFTLDIDKDPNPFLIINTAIWNLRGYLGTGDYAFSELIYDEETKTYIAVFQDPIPEPERPPKLPEEPCYTVGPQILDSEKFHS